MPTCTDFHGGTGGAQDPKPVRNAFGLTKNLGKLHCGLFPQDGSKLALISCADPEAEGY